MSKNAANRRANGPSMPPASLEMNLSDSGMTELLGQALAHALPGAAPASPGTPAGAVLYLHGELGAGKTTCVRSLLRTLGAVGPVRSPTYTLVETYRLGAWTCVHVDLYRLHSAVEVDELGLRDLVGPGCLLLIEWPEKGGAAVPPADVDLTLRYRGDGRHARMCAATDLGADWLRNLGLDTRLVPYLSNLT
jgi:tRNA threonylcarbamoyladenosine biosynthesis protein TsaE